MTSVSPGSEGGAGTSPLAQRPSGTQPGLWGGNILTVKVTRLIRSLSGLGKKQLLSAGLPGRHWGGFVVNRSHTPREQPEGAYPGGVCGAVVSPISEACLLSSEGRGLVRSPGWRQGSASMPVKTDTRISKALHSCV